MTVVVTSAAWRCQANYGGTITGDGTPALVVAVARYTNMLNTQGETQIIMTTAE